MRSFFGLSLLLLVAGLAWASTAEAAEWYYWNQTSENWVNDPSYWTCTYPVGSPAAVPGLDDFAVIKTPGTVKIDADHTFATDWAGFAEPLDQIWVGDGSGITGGTSPYSPYAPGEGHVLQTGGDVQFTRGFKIARAEGTTAAPGHSTYVMQGGTITQIEHENPDVFEFAIGERAGGSGALTMSGGAITANSRVFIGTYGGTGTVTMSGDAHLASTLAYESMYVGFRTGASGTMTMTGSADAEAPELYVGCIGSSSLQLTTTGLLNMSEDTTFTTQRFFIAWDGYSKGTVNLDGNAVFTNAADMYVGIGGNSYPCEAELRVKGNATLSTTELWVGLFHGARGTMTVASESANPADTAEVTVNGRVAVGCLGGVNGTLTVGDEGIVTHTAGDILVGAGDHNGDTRGTGEVVMNGGTFDNTAANDMIRIGIQFPTPHVHTGLAGNGTWTQNGGTLLNNTLGVQFGQGDVGGGAGGNATLNLNGGIFEAAFIQTDATAAPANATVNFNGGTLRATASSENFVGDGGTTPVLAAKVQNGGAVIDSNGFDVTITAALVEDAASTGGGLEKKGLGTLTLTGANDYSGDTVVTAGTLSLTAAMLDDASDLRIALEAKVDLNFTGADTIAGLYLNGMDQALGTWGSLASAADHKSDYFTGEGMVLVAGIPSVIPGDTDNDNDVDADDAAVLAQHWGQSVEAGHYQSGDFNGDGVVNAADASILAANWTGTIESATVPEPSGLALLAAGLGVMGLLHRRR